MTTQKSTEKSKTGPKKITEEIAKMQVSKKTAYIIIAVLVALVLLGIYLYRWYDVKKEEKLMNSYLLSSDTISLEIKNLDEVPQILTEAPNDYFVLISYTGNEDNYNLEQGLKLIIDSYKLADRFYYLNIENIIKEDNYLARLNTAFNTDKISTTPIILYYKDGKIVDTVTRIDNQPINAGDFQKLLDIYEFEGQ